MPIRIPWSIKEFLRAHLAFVATVDLKGAPNVVPKGDMAVLDDSTIVFADLYSHQTRKNLENNPNIAITVVNPAGYTGYQIKGKAKIIERGAQYDKLAKQLGQDGQLNHPQARYAIKVSVSKIIDIGYGERADKEIKMI